MINVCATLGGNTGQATCDVKMGRPKYLLLTSGKTFSAAQMADSAAFKVALLAAMLLSNSDANKVFVFPEMRDITNNTPEPTEEALADGYSEMLNEDLPKYLLRSTPGACLQQQMASFNGWVGGIYVVDHNNILWYRVTTTGGGSYWSTGYLYTPPPMFRGSTGINTANTRLTFGSIDEFKYNVGALKLDFNVKSLTNLLDVDLVDLESENTSGALNNVFIVGGLTRCEKTNLYTAFADALNNTNRWRAYKSDGTALTVSTVSKNATLKGWNITILAGDYSGMSSGDVFYIDLETPTALAALGVAGIEGIKLRFVKF